MSLHLEIAGTVALLLLAYLVCVLLRPERF